MLRWMKKWGRGRGSEGWRGGGGGGRGALKKIFELNFQRYLWEKRSPLLQVRDDTEVDEELGKRKRERRTWGGRRAVKKKRLELNFQRYVWEKRWPLPQTRENAEMDQEVWKRERWGGGGGA